MSSHPSCTYNISLDAQRSKGIQVPGCFYAMFKLWPNDSFSLLLFKQHFQILKRNLKTDNFFFNACAHFVTEGRLRKK